jgi:hypothetical protein
MPSERKFGFLFAAIFCGLSIYAYYKNWHALVVAAYFATGCILWLIALVMPGILAPLNKAWFWLGQTMGKIVSPVVLGIIFFLLITPIAALGRLFGRDELKLKRSPQESYWVERSPPGPDPDSFKNQF